MGLLTTFIYRLGLESYRMVLTVASWGHPKAQKWVEGRRTIWRRIQQDLVDNTAPINWIHCASLGEFEQARPLIEQLKKNESQEKIFLTFFSPSGYEYCKNYSLADWVYYLPLDSPNNARKMLGIVNPQQAFFIKYEYWYYYLHALQKNQIPTYLVAAIFRPEQVFFRFYGGFFRNMLSCFTQIFVQDVASQELLESIQIDTGEIVGDTRLDRVLKIKDTAKEQHIVAQFAKDRKTLVAGSTWMEDEVLLQEVLVKDPSYCLVIAPHEIGIERLQSIERLFNEWNPIYYSRCESQPFFSQDQRVLIIDNMGMLNQLYRYATVAYIGGGLGAGIHNCLEAAVYKIAVLFGSNYHKFREAKDLIQLGVAFEVKTARDTLSVLAQIEEENRQKAIQKAAQTYLEEHRGATQKIMDVLYRKN